jgi:hypothetical protein
MTNSRFEIFSKYNGLRATGLIGNPSDHSLLNGHVVDVALGLRGDSPKAGWISAAALKQATFENDPEAQDGVILTIPSEVQPLNRWWCRVDGDDVRITRYTYGSSTGDVYREINCDDFRRVDGGQLMPFKIESRTANSDADGRKYYGETIEITVRQYRPASGNTPDRYLMVWPLETKVFDQRTRASFLIRKAPRTLDDDFIAATEEARLRQTQERLNQIATQPVPATTQP